MADQQTAYRPTPISQRDGSSLANSNCRMASIATGLDYDTLGAKRSTGAKMRSYTSDQSGGTDSGDAEEAWERGYGENLSVRDGNSWADALADLREGHLVHLDVWHATTGGPCLSGSGAYGHTIAVLPDLEASGWSVADPWCSPGKWSRVTEAKLKAGAEEWGRRVFGTAKQEPDYPTGGLPYDHPLVRAVVSRMVRRLMTLSRPGHITPIPDHPPETGGPQPILYTVSTSHPPSGGGGGGDMPGMVLTDVQAAPGTATMEETGPIWRVADDAEKEANAGTTWETTGTARYHDGSLGRMVRANASDGQLHIVANSRVTFTPAPVPEPPPCPECPPDPECPDVDAEVAAAVALRDEEWEAWHLAGAPSQADPAKAP